MKRIASLLCISSGMAENILGWPNKELFPRLRIVSDAIPARNDEILDMAGCSTRNSFQLDTRGKSLLES